MNEETRSYEKVVNTTLLVSHAAHNCESSVLGLKDDKQLSKNMLR